MFFKLYTIFDIKLGWKQLRMKYNTGLHIWEFFSRSVNKKGNN